MSWRQLKIYGALLVAITTAVSSVMVGMRLLGATDELTVVLMIGVYGIGMFLGGFIPDDPPPDQR